MRFPSSTALLALALALSVSTATAKKPTFTRHAVPHFASITHRRSIGLRNHAAARPVAVTSSSASVAVNIPRGGAGADEFVTQAYDWATNLGAPAALVAGAVIATLYENMSSGSLDVMERTDSTWIKIAKKATRLFLLSAFILQIICIFCTTVLGTHLLSHEPAVTKATTALQYLNEQYEFEYLTSRIAFLQGLLTWLAAIALEHAIPHGDETPGRRNVDILISSSLFSLIIIMLSFYNGHMNFYDNYFEMLMRYGQVTYERFCARWPPRFMAVLALPPLVISLVYSVKVFLGLDEGGASPVVGNKKRM